MGWGFFFLPPVTCEVAFHVYDNPGELGRITPLCLIRLVLNQRKVGALYMCADVLDELRY